MSSSGQAAAADKNRPKAATAGAPAIGGAPPADEAPQGTKAPAAPAKGRRRTVLLAVAALVVAGLVIYYIRGRSYEDTDDAQIDGNISNVGPRVSGIVTAVRVIENQTVHAGEPMIDIDPADLALAVAQAKASVAQAEAQLQAEDPSVSITESSNVAALAGASSDVVSGTAGLTAARKDVEQLEARLQQAEENARLAEVERRRGDELWKAQAIPRADLDRRMNAAQTSASEVLATNHALAAARQKVSQQEAAIGASRSRLTEVRANAPRQVASRRASVLFRQANLDLAKAQLAQAELNLSYAALRAPVAGVVAKKAVNVGDHVSPGQQLLAIAQTDALWVTANFRETQLEHMQPGQSVDIHVDALGTDMTGKVESLGGVTGARLSVLPPENASGNYVKVVQRIPVRIRLDPGQPGLDRLRPGMSVEPRVRNPAVSAASGAIGGAQQRPAYFDTGWTNGHNPWAIALVVTMATFMEVLDTSIANVSLPHIAGNLSVSQDESTWVLTSYLVSNAVVLPISGWIASKIGRKRFYMICVVLFTSSSFLCGIAPSLGTLIFFRVLQGIGGGGLGPSEQAILADTFPPAKRGMAFAVYGMAVVLAPAIGPTLGGFITDHFSWRWIFFINVPVGVVSLMLTQRLVSDPPHIRTAKERTGGIDYIGLSLIAIGLASLEIVLDKGQEDNWFTSPFITAATVISAVTLVSFVLWERKHPNPVVDVNMFKNRTFAVANVMMLTLGIALFGSTVLLPQFLQVLMGYTAQQSGMALSPGGFVVIMLLPMVGVMVSRVDARYMIAFGFVMLSGSLFYMTSHLYLGIDFPTAIKLRVIQSIGLPFLFIPINTMVYAGVAPQKNNAVSGIVNLSRNMGGDIGIAFVTTLIARRVQFHQSTLAAHTNNFNPTFNAQVNGIARTLERAGATSLDAMHKALAVVYFEMQRQTVTLAYLDAIKSLAIATGAMLPLLLLTRRVPRGATPGGH